MPPLPFNTPKKRPNHSPTESPKRYATLQVGEKDRPITKSKMPLQGEENIRMPEAMRKCSSPQKKEMPPKVKTPKKLTTPKIIQRDRTPRKSGARLLALDSPRPSTNRGLHGLSIVTEDSEMASSGNCIVFIS